MAFKKQRFIKGINNHAVHFWFDRALMKSYHFHYLVLQKMPQQAHNHKIPCKQMSNINSKFTTSSSFNRAVKKH